MLIIAGHLTVAPADRDAFVADCAGVVAQARRAPGCLDYALAADPLEPGRVNVLERWADAAALAAFRGSGPDDATAARILAADVGTYRIAEA